MPTWARRLSNQLSLPASRWDFAGGKIGTWGPRESGKGSDLLVGSKRETMPGMEESDVTFCRFLRDAKQSQICCGIHASKQTCIEPTQ